MPKRDIDSVDRSDGSNGDVSQGMSKAPKRKIDLGGDRRANDGGNAADSGPSQESAFSPWTGRPFSGRYYSILETRRKLTVYLFKDKLMDVVKANQVVIVEGASVLRTEWKRMKDSFSLHFESSDTSPLALVCKYR
jgi:hypothetical protein